MALKQKRAGFTLVELMIAMIAGSIAVTGVYYLNSVTARSYQQQMSVSDAQMSLRSAVDQLRRDIARAGYLAAPASSQLRNCSGALPATTTAAGYNTENSPRAFQAVSVGFNGSLSYNKGSALSGAQVTALIGTNSVRADDLTLIGNYTTSDAYLAETLAANICGGAANYTQLQLQTGRESFRRSFFTPANGSVAETPDYALFKKTFSTDRMVRVEQAGRYYFADIANSDWTASSLPTITLVSPGLPNCVDTCSWMAVAPVDRIHYGIESDLGPDFSRLVGNSGIVGSRRAMLVRRRENIRTGAAIANEARVVLDYAVEFAIDAIYNSAATGARPTWAYAIGSAALSTLNTNTPEDYQALVVTLASRAIEADANLPALTRGLPFNQAGTVNKPLFTYNVIDPNFPAITNLNARVRSLRTEIFLQNL
jgi:prepilin-type N-terminal cleavage/methylation domain-containing protein